MSLNQLHQFSWLDCMQAYMAMLTWTASWRWLKWVTSPDTRSTDWKKTILCFRYFPMHNGRSEIDIIRHGWLQDESTLSTSVWHTRNEVQAFWPQLSTLWLYRTCTSCTVALLRCATGRRLSLTARLTRTCPIIIQSNARFLCDTVRYASSALGAISLATSR